MPQLRGNEPILGINRFCGSFQYVCSLAGKRLGCYLQGGAGGPNGAIWVGQHYPAQFYSMCPTTLPRGFDEIPGWDVETQPLSLWVIWSYFGDINWDWHLLYDGSLYLRRGLEGDSPDVRGSHSVGVGRSLIWGWQYDYWRFDSGRPHLGVGDASCGCDGS